MTDRRTRNAARDSFCLGFRGWRAQRNEAKVGLTTRGIGCSGLGSETPKLDKGVRLLTRGRSMRNQGVEVLLEGN